MSERDKGRRWWWTTVGNTGLDRHQRILRDRGLPYYTPLGRLIDPREEAFRRMVRLDRFYSSNHSFGSSNVENGIKAAFQDFNKGIEAAFDKFEKSLHIEVKK